MKRVWSAIVLGTGLVAAHAPPAFARGAAVREGPRGGTMEHAQGARRSGTAVQGPRGGSAAHGQGPAGSRTAVEGPRGGTAVSRQSYEWNGAHYARPVWNTSRVTVYQRGFVAYPGFRPYATYGLVAPLAAFTGLAFLSAGMLIGSYAAQQKTVYVYVVNQAGKDMEYRVDSEGHVLSSQPAK